MISVVVPSGNVVKPIRFSTVTPGKFPIFCFSPRSEEHTSELQSRENLVCRLVLEKKNDRPARRARQHPSNGAVKRHHQPRQLCSRRDARWCHGRGRGHPCYVSLHHPGRPRTARSK